MASNGSALKSPVVGILIFATMLCALIGLGSPQIAQAAVVTTSTNDSFYALEASSGISEDALADEPNDGAPTTFVASAQELADTLNADAPAEQPNAKVSEDGTTVILLAPVEIADGNGLEIAVPEGQGLTLDLASYNLTLQNGGTDATAQLIVSGAGALTITSSGGAVMSRTADGTIPAISVTGGELTLQTALTLETPIAWSDNQYIVGVEVNGGTLTLPEGAAISGGGEGPALVMVSAGALNLTGGELTSANADLATLLMIGGTATLTAGEVTSPDKSEGFAFVALDEATASIAGATINGVVEGDEGATVTICGSYVSGHVYNSTGKVRVVPAPAESEPTTFGVPVGLKSLDGSVQAVEFDYNGTSPDGYYAYFATIEDAENDAARSPNANVSPVSEQGYLCGLAFADNADAANDFYRNFFGVVNLDPPDMTFTGPAVIGLAVFQSELEHEFALRNAAGETIYSEVGTTTESETGSVYAQMYFDASLPDAVNPDNAVVGTGDYMFEVTDPDNPSDVYTAAPLAVSQVTIDPNGGTLPEGTPAVSWMMQDGWLMDDSDLPTRPGYALSGWTSAPVPDMVTWIDDFGWALTLPKEAGEFTLTAQWEPDVVAVSRLWNPYNGAHLLTTDANEVSTLTGAGWKDDGTVFSEYGSAYPNSTPVTRVYNPFNGDHLYSTSESEVADLVGYGWQDEGVKFYGSPETTIPVYRLWNSLQTAEGGLGSHLWTADQNEYDTLPQLPPVGAWQQEGAVWNAVSIPE